jgi:phage FluMu gp28-like protein
MKDSPLPHMTFTDPVKPRELTALIEELPRGAEIPPDLDPLADGVLMRHQSEWLEDESPLKLGEKGRRTGITFAEALDDTLIAAAARSAGGDNVFYIGDTKDKGREFIGYVAHFAKTVAKELVTIEEFMFLDQREDGSSGEIAAFRIRFASGFRVEALSSRPENIRGLQGVVVIDEAAFHKDVRLVLDAVNALLIWGGRIRIISTHNGVLNPFNELIREAKAGKVPYSLHFIPFSKAVQNGLYERVCLLRGRIPTPEGKAAWETKIRSAYGVREAAMKQELDCIPAEMEGAALTRVQIENAMIEGVPVVRLVLPDSFRDQPPATRADIIARFCQDKLAPVLARLDPSRPHYFGEDFARSGDATSLLVAAQERTLKRRGRLLLELRNVPFEAQRDIAFYVVERLPRFSGGACDASGNGAYLAEALAMKFGNRVVEVKASAEWYRVNGLAYVEAITDQTILLPQDEDVLRDHQALSYVNGVVKVPDDMRFKGSDGLERHGDSAIAGMLCWFASCQGTVEFAYRGVVPNQEQPQGHERGRMVMGEPPDDDFTRTERHRGPLGATLRGGV